MNHHGPRPHGLFSAVLGSRAGCRAGFLEKWFGKQPQPRLVESIVGRLSLADGPFF